MKRKVCPVCEDSSCEVKSSLCGKDPIREAENLRIADAMLRSGTVNAKELDRIAKESEARNEITTGPLMCGSSKLGQIVKYPDGFRFLPATDAHKPSRKAWPTAESCIPSWAYNLIAATRGYRS